MRSLVAPEEPVKVDLLDELVSVVVAGSSVIVAEVLEAVSEGSALNEVIVSV